MTLHRLRVRRGHPLLVPALLAATVAAIGCDDPASLAADGATSSADAGRWSVDFALMAADLAPARDLAVAVDLTPVRAGPSADVAEAVLDTWDVGESVDNNVEPCAPMKRGLVSLAADRARVASGSESARIDYGPTGAAYFEGLYPRSRDGGWDLSSRAGVALSVDGEVGLDYIGWEIAGPTIVLCSASGGYRRLDPIANHTPVTPAIGPAMWTQLRVPLAGDAAWTVQDSGGFDLRAVDWIEVHVNPYKHFGTGMCRLWIDDLRFY